VELTTKKQAQAFADRLWQKKKEYLEEIKMIRIELDEINVELRVLKSEWGVSPKKRRRHE
jgi:hypothetical protein